MTPVAEPHEIEVLPLDGDKYTVLSPDEATSTQDAVELPREPLTRRASGTFLWSPRRIRLARWLKRQGFQNPYRIVRAAVVSNLAMPRALAMLTMETGSCRNVYGHDPVRNRAPKGGAVTRSNYRGIYLPDRRAGLGMQGVGPTQLTWFAFQDRADALGGCPHPYFNMRVGFAIFREYRRAGADVWEAAKRYNGADAYADRFVAWDREWAKRLRRAGF